MSQKEGIPYSKLNKEQMSKVVEQVEEREMHFYNKNKGLWDTKDLNRRYPDGEPTSSRSRKRIRRNPDDARTKVISYEDVTYYFSNHPNPELRGTLTTEKVEATRSGGKHPLQRPSKKIAPINFP